MMTLKNRNSQPNKGNTTLELFWAFVNNELSLTKRAEVKQMIESSPENADILEGLKALHEIHGNNTLQYINETVETIDFESLIEEEQEVIEKTESLPLGVATKTDSVYIKNSNNGSSSGTTETLVLTKSFPNTSLNGEVGIFQNNGKEDINKNPYEPVLIDVKKAFTVQVKWQNHKEIPSPFIGKWKIDILAEEWGKGETYLPDECSQKTIEWNVEGNYQCEIVIPPNIIKAGLYKIAICLEMCSNTNGAPPKPIGFIELPAVKFYNPA